MIKKQKIQQIVNCFETGSAEGNYGDVSIFNDGPNKIKQITFGRSQCTQYGHLPELLRKYVENKGKYSAETSSKLPLKADSWKDKSLITTLKSSGSDPIMVKCQDDLFETKYFAPAMRWADENGFKENLSLLVIYDSFIHSGCILSFLREKFSAKTPKNGGSERDWISQYIDVRHNWLANHSNKILRKTIYRTNDMKKAIAAKDWNLDSSFVANGVKVI